MALLGTCFAGLAATAGAHATPGGIPATIAVPNNVGLVRGLRVVGQVPDAVRNLISSQIGTVADTERLVADREQLRDGMISRGYLEAQVQMSRDDDGHYRTGC